MREPASNFSHLEAHDSELVRLGVLAERSAQDDPDRALLHLRQLTARLAQRVAGNVGLDTWPNEGHNTLLMRLEEQGVLPRDVVQLFDEVRLTGLTQSHDYRDAVTALKIAWQLGLWFHRTFVDPSFKPGPFVPLRVTVARPGAGKGRERQGVNLTQSGGALNAYASAAQAAADEIHLDEAETRRLIDRQLREAGWIAHSAALTYSRGARPEKGKNLAIAEWPTANGPADYVLFVGLTPVAAVEAKRKNRDVSAALQQAKRYSRGFVTEAGTHSPGGPWREHTLPFVFAANGRPYLRQLKTRSGIWFCDVRRPGNLGRALDGWYTPQGLSELLKIDEDYANERLGTEPFAYGFILRPYQLEAIRAAESAMARGRREMLLAMATGTGKTKTCIALIYRLLKAQRFRRVLFLVDRSALGEQAANAFKDTRMESLQTFADVFGVKELEEQPFESDAAVHVATVQGMVRRLLHPFEGSAPPAVDQYDCIIVDECHRGYLLDRELSDAELAFRGSDDYVSKYRRVLDHFDAVKIGLTATPALHTTQIFGAPIYLYSYREAVLDGYLVDHDPPVQIHTVLSTSGIIWRVGDEVPMYDSRRDHVQLFTTPDEIKLEVESFNRRVVTEAFNRVVCNFLARELDPASRQKSLVFCVNDAHADLVVHLLKEAFQQRFGGVDDDAVIKITGAADNPLQLIRRFKNERNPNVAVTVDLLTTGVDVPEICNLVFLRRVNSRILFDQMLGRATRPCGEVGKETFRIFDAVRIYEALQDLTAMQPVVIDPSVSFSQLARELTEATRGEVQSLVRDQLVAKLQRKKRHLAASTVRDLETTVGMSVEAFVEKLRTLTSEDVAIWLAQFPDVGGILDQRGGGVSAPLFVSQHEDELLGTGRGYGKATRPEDYLREFAEFVRSRGNTIPALVTVLTRPRELTRKQLRELALELDRAGFTEAGLSTAWREMTNQEIAARIMGFIRQAAIGDPLVPYEKRVDAALARMLASRGWSGPQRQWLEKIAAQTKANLVVDRDALDDPDLVFRREGGGFARLDRIFEGQLQQVLETFNESLWQPAA